jgi:hypothetical protein
MQPAPFRGSHAEFLFEHEVEETQMTIARRYRDACDPVVGFHEQLPRGFESQLDLPRANGSFELFPKHAAQVAQAAAAQFRELPRG